ncbi:hypothetical protein H6G97_28815 [Nostoc flagelliforme FACHB-838]|uniref:Uncharacterized protein n=1 Tax=Nostoc flagelliforme FACHB-838 TaxID=2692904 RepID=A0ABR8DVU8_9NOSO|nr:hypothetical protein [Nostoc flagelliforme]MBD2533348.1 hypothetical protein [Nostoc flagelliforme FACHB-838]
MESIEAKINNGFVGMTVRETAFSPKYKRSDGRKSWLKKRAERLAERLRPTEIDPEQI